MTRTNCLNPYSFSERKYFNTAAGIRATDKNHAVAQQQFKRMKKLEGTESGIKLLAHEGYETVEQARALVAQMLGCKSRNIVFGNSGSMVAMLAIRAVYKEFGKKNIKLICHSDYQYPTVVLAPFLSWEEVSSILTRQNFGVAPQHHFVLASKKIQRIMQNGMFGLDMGDVNLGSNFWQYVSPQEREKIFKKKFKGFRFDRDIAMGYEIEELKEIIAHSSLFTLSTLKKAIDAARILYGQDPFLYHLIFGILDRVDRYTGELAGIEALNEFDYSSFEFGISLPFNLNLISMVDGSHSFSIADFDPSRFLTQAQQLKPFVPEGNCDIYIANSSKGLGAEPTIGIMYVSDKILQFIEKNLTRIYPKIAFQFSPESALGVKPDEVEKTKYWLSLPEFASMKFALEERMKLNFKWVLSELQTVRDKLTNGLSAFGQYDLEVLSTPINAIPGSGNDLGFDSYGMPLHGRSSVIYREPIPNYVTLGLLNSAFDSKDIRILLEEKGYAVASSEVVSTILLEKKGAENHSLTQYLRISFRPGINYDINGFLEALESVLSTLKKEQASK